VPKDSRPRRRYDLTVTVKQSDVPEGFKAIVPVSAQFGDKAGTVFVLIDEPEKNDPHLHPGPAKKVLFNPQHAVLARVKP